MISGTEAFADKCQDFLLLDGSEEILQYGIDTTHHWWAITSPFSGQYRLIIDGESSGVYQKISDLTFSPDGERWACFAADNTQWHLLTNDTIIRLPGNEAGELHFSPNSQVLVYSFKHGYEETIVMKNRKIRVLNKTGRFFLSNGGERIAFIGKRSNGFVINIDGKESTLYDEIRPIGFWYDGKMLFAARNGNRWQVYKNDEPLSDIYNNIYETTINLDGTVAGFGARLSSGECIGVMISDEYYDPVVSKPYSSVHGIVLHPTLAMIAFNAVFEGTNLVVFSGTEYAGGRETTGEPFFSYDGSELLFLGCSLDCFANINGRQFPIYSGLSTESVFAIKPNTRTIAYSTSSSLVVRYLERKGLFAGMMVDRTIPPRYNWRTDRYEALGDINNRLYMLTCKI